MNTQQCKNALLAKNHDLSSFTIRREDIAVEKNAEPLDDIQRNADCIMALDSLTRNWQTSSLIVEALERIEKQTYGLCTECEAQIGEKRLAALPWAKRCIQCQEAADSESPVGRMPHDYERHDYERHDYERMDDYSRGGLDHVWNLDRCRSGARRIFPRISVRRRPDRTHTNRNYREVKMATSIRNVRFSIFGIIVGVVVIPMSVLGVLFLAEKIVRWHVYPGI